MGGGGVVVKEPGLHASSLKMVGLSPSCHLCFFEPGALPKLLEGKLDLDKSVW